MKNLLMAVALTAGLTVPAAAEEETTFMAPLGLESCAYVKNKSKELGEVYRLGTEIFAIGYLNAVSIMLYADKGSVNHVPEGDNTANVYLAAIKLYCERNPSASYIEAVANSLDAVSVSK
ncbi:hypothetical protein BZG00_16045 [Salinivibrio kushneri]|uniref:Rap1a immunity protein domain-containing protein n=2 Tax=Pseudomonadota TaxID=1224 RepID=A0A922T8U0_9HYPH|nr:MULTISPECIES: hypothetical protein [Pseudomonadota]YP_008126011.1 hypothetical protein M610_gp040 [Alteromonas phage vB_AmaP_AD45-P1]AGM46978.1 hypothetical protein AD45P3_00200 [Alteromonas phage vB_AmaP_AD45-P3]AGM47095.1 hypothetical protein AD45P4_00200 [Alteromonas phage vB_AmaP_AD45-P4]AGM47210.1 hypothetical protein AD45P2_00195 [Alteromonas phage vB_AmaP_AD45-P2]AGM46858.1 hypothetical protein AD45P1_00200 [Alteromonas phage vB_AmaP_AD45-P1]KEQ05552.1 hypothetical protein GV68_0846